MRADAKKGKVTGRKVTGKKRTGKEPGLRKAGTADGRDSKVQQTEDSEEKAIWSGLCAMQPAKPKVWHTDRQGQKSR